MSGAPERSTGLTDEPGDAGQFAAVAEELATDHLVITYDRRGTSRSAGISGWSETTVMEQADDAAAVLSLVGVPSALVFGTSNGAVAFSVELPAFQAYRPDPDRLAGCRVPVTVLVGEGEQLPFFHEAASWLADRLGTTVGSAPGAHGPQFSAPAQLAATIRAVEAGRSR